MLTLSLLQGLGEASCPGYQDHTLVEEEWIGVAGGGGEEGLGRREEGGEIVIKM